MAVTLQRSLLPARPARADRRRGRPPLPAGPGRRGRRLVRRHPAARRPGRAGGRRRRRPRPARRGHHGPAAHRRAHLLLPRSASRRAPQAPRRAGRPRSTRTRPTDGRDGRHRRHLSVRRLRPGRPGCARWPGPGTRPPAGPPRRHGGRSRRAGRPAAGAGRRLPFESAEFTLPEGSQLVLYTDGLIEDRDRDIDTGLDLLRDALHRPRPDPGGDLRGRPRRPAARPPERRHRPARRPYPPAGRRPGRRLGRPGRPRRRRPGTRRRRPAAGRLGPGGDRLHHRTRPQRAGHQRHPLRHPADPAPAAARPPPDLRGLRRQQHLAAPAPGGRPPTRAAGACSSSPSSRSAGAPATCLAAKSSGPSSHSTVR